jgi:hypothetical protein
MKTLFATAFLIFAFSLTGSAQKCAQFTMPGEAFVFCPPTGWKLTKNPATKDVEFESSSKTSKFPASITVFSKTIEDARGPGALELIKQTLDTAKTTKYENMRLIGLKDVTPPSRLNATSMIFDFEMGGIPMSTGYFLVEGPKILERQ